MKNDSEIQDNQALIQRIPKKEMTHLVEGYVGYMAKFKYLRYVIFAVVAVIAGYNFFVAGKRYPIAELNMIQGIMAMILGVFVLFLLILAVTLFRTLRKLKKELSKTAEKHDIEPKIFRKEFHNFVKAAIGGPGLR